MKYDKKSNALSELKAKRQERERRDMERAQKQNKNKNKNKGTTTIRHKAYFFNLVASSGLYFHSIWNLA